MHRPASRQHLQLTEEWLQRLVRQRRAERRSLIQTMATEGKHHAAFDSVTPVVRTAGSHPLGSLCPGNITYGPCRLLRRAKGLQRSCLPLRLCRPHVCSGRQLRPRQCERHPAGFATGHVQHGRRRSQRDLPLGCLRFARQEGLHTTACRAHLPPVQGRAAGRQPGSQAEYHQQVTGQAGRPDGRKSGQGYLRGWMRQAATSCVAHNVHMNSLDGIRILDCSRVLAGPWCTQTLADLGADVVKVERPPGPQHPGGDDTRGWGPPFLRDRDGSDTAEAAYYMGANRNKRSITCDLAQPEGQALIRELAARADVFVENYKVGDMARYGLDYDSLKTINPRLVYCSVTGFGQTGPYRERAGYDYAIQGMGGLMSVTGERDDLPGGGPQKVGVAVADLFTGMYATVGILAALRHAERTGQGQHIDMALLDTQVAMLANLGANYLVRGRSEGRVPGRAGNAHANIVPYQVFEVAPDANGQAQHIILAVGNDGQFAKFCDVAGLADLALDARFARNADRVRHREVLIPLLAGVMRTRGKSDWLTALEAAKVPCGPINSLAEVFDDPQVLARGMVHRWTHPLADAVDLVASPLKLSLTPVRSDLPPPLLGQHTAEVLSEWLGIDDAGLSGLVQKGIVQG